MSDADPWSRLSNVLLADGIGQAIAEALDDVEVVVEDTNRGRSYSVLATFYQGRELVRLMIDTSKPIDVSGSGSQGGEP